MVYVHSYHYNMEAGLPIHKDQWLLSGWLQKVVRVFLYTQHQMLYHLCRAFLQIQYNMTWNKTLLYTMWKHSFTCRNPSKKAHLTYKQIQHIHTFQYTILCRNMQDGELLGLEHRLICRSQLHLLLGQKDFLQIFLLGLMHIKYIQLRIELQMDFDLLYFTVMELSALSLSTFTWHWHAH